MLENKRGLVFGIANNHSIAWGIAKQLAENGAKIAIGYQNEILLKSCLLYTSPSPRDMRRSRMPSSA